jgi:hypothetical protein
MLGNKYVTKRNKHLPGTKLFDEVGILKVTIKTAGDHQTFDYPLPQLNDIMKKVKDSLDIDRPVVVGVMSGANHTDNGVVFSTDPAHLAPEHYVLIFGQDGDKFFFWDPDVTSSDIKTENWGEGFGVFFHRHDRIGTAFSDDDLKTVDANGYHTLAPKKRHRYQAYYLRNGLSFAPANIKLKLRYDTVTKEGLPGK